MNTAPRDSYSYMYNHVICIMNSPKVISPHPTVVILIPVAAAAAGSVLLLHRAMLQTTQTAKTLIFRANCSFPLYRKTIILQHATLSIHGNNIYIAYEIYTAFRPVKEVHKLRIQLSFYDFWCNCQSGDIAH